MINNLKEFFDNAGICEMHSGAMHEYGNALYKYTFGPWIAYIVETSPGETREIHYGDDEAESDTLELSDKCVGIKVGSIVEGADYDATPFELRFPFDAKAYDDAMNELSSEVDEEWRKNNCITYKVINAETREVVSWNQWVSMDDEPTGDWAEDDTAAKDLAIAAGNALWEADLADTDIPGHTGYLAVEYEELF